MKCYCIFIFSDSFSEYKYANFMLENAFTDNCNSEIFPGVIPPDPQAGGQPPPAPTPSTAFSRARSQRDRPSASKLSPRMLNTNRRRWLVAFKSGGMMYKTVNGMAPTYLQEYVISPASSRSLLRH